MASAQGVLSTLKVGTHDDGTSEGVLLTKQRYGQLIKLPIQAGAIVSGASGSGSSSTQVGIMTNPDGSSTAWNLTAAPLVPPAQSSAWMETMLYGPRIGVRFRRNFAAGLVPFTVWVDGVPYSVRNAIARRHAATALSISDHDGLFMIADDLGPGPHTVRASLAGDQAGGITRSVVLYGWMVDTIGGYVSSLQAGSGIPSSGTTVPLVATTVPTQGPTARVAKIYLHNTDVATRIVTFTLSGATFKTVTLAAGADAEVAFARGVQPLSAFKWQADGAANMVNAVVEELTN